MNLENLNKCGKRIDEYVEMLKKPPYGVDMPKLLTMSREDIESIVEQLRRSADAISVISKLLLGQTNLLNNLVEDQPIVAKPKHVMFHRNDDGTVVTTMDWSDGSVTSAKNFPEDEFDAITGINICLAEHAVGNKNRLKKLYKKFAPEAYEEQFNG